METNSFDWLNSDVKNKTDAITIDAINNLIDSMKARFIQLTTKKGKTLFILCNNIIAIEELMDGTIIYLYGPGAFEVKESTESIAKEIGLRYVT